MMIFLQIADPACVHAQQARAQALHWLPPDPAGSISLAEACLLQRQLQSMPKSRFKTAKCMHDCTLAHSCGLPPVSAEPCLPLPYAANDGFTKLLMPSLEAMALPPSAQQHASCPW